MMFQLWARVIESSTSRTKLITSSRCTSSGKGASRASAMRMARAHARSVLPGLDILSGFPGKISRGGLASSRKRSSGGAPEEALGAEDQNHEEDHQADDLAVGAAEGGGADGLGDADEEAGHERAQHGAEPGQHDHDQRLERPLEPDRRAHRVAHAH